MTAQGEHSGAPGLRALGQLFSEGAISVCTYSSVEGARVLAVMSVIQADGDVVLRIREDSLHDGPMTVRHFDEVGRVLLELEQTRRSLERAMAALRGCRDLALVAVPAGALLHVVDPLWSELLAALAPLSVPTLVLGALSAAVHVALRLWLRQVRRVLSK
jgi:hypothetical protein